MRVHVHVRVRVRMCMHVAAEGNSNRPPGVRPSLGLLLPRHSSALPQ